MKREFKCERCGGRMTFEWFAGKAGLVGCWRYSGWRCICCGEVIDSLILINRIRSGKPKEHAIWQKAPFSLEQSFWGDGFKQA